MMVLVSGVILLSSFVSASNMKDETKTSYFVAVGIITFLTVLFSIL